MPVFVAPKSLIDISIDSLCTIAVHVLAKSLNITEKTDDAVQVVEDQMEEVFSKVNSDGSSKSVKPDTLQYTETKKAALDLLNVKHLVQKHGDFEDKFTKYIDLLPTEYKNEVLNRLLNDFFKVVGGHDEDHVEHFMNERWSFPTRIKVAFRILLKCLLSKRIFTLNLNKLTNKYFKIFSDYLMKTELYKDNEYMNEMKLKNYHVFNFSVISFQHELSSLTSISMQHLADGDLIWCVSCYCPNLWYLDVSGEMFDLQRYCVYKEASGEYVTAVIKNDVRQFQRAGFLDALCGLYGNNEEVHYKYDSRAQGCYKLRRLLLPNYQWETDEENTLVDETVKLFQSLPYLEEVSGVCLLRVLLKLNELGDDAPLMLKLKKFDGTSGGNRINLIDPKKLKKVKLPLVEEVVFIVNVVIPPATLQQLFPNMKYLTVSPYNSQSYSFPSILPYLRNLVSLDIEFLEGLALSHMCDLARQCCLLKSLSITCPALYVKLPFITEFSIELISRERKELPFSLRVDKQEKMEYDGIPHKGNSFKVFYYEHKLTNVCWSGVYPREDDSVPNFSNLQILQFFDLQSVDHYALFQILRGSPFVQKFTVVINRVESLSRPWFDDYFVGRIAPLLKRAKEVTIAAEKKEEDHLKMNGTAIAHLLYFCPNIRSISRVGDWDLSDGEIKGLNYYFQEKNYVVRLH